MPTYGRPKNELSFQIDADCSLWGKQRSPSRSGHLRSCALYFHSFQDRSPAKRPCPPSRPPPPHLLPAIAERAELVEDISRQIPKGTPMRSDIDFCGQRPANSEHVLRFLVRFLGISHGGAFGCFARRR